MNRDIVFLMFLLLLIGCSSTRAINHRDKDVSPNDYGLLEAKNGEETYWAIYRAHNEAVLKGVNVNYNGIEKLVIDIPSNALSIPLSDNNDFKGVTIVVRNQSKDIVLFSKINSSSPIDVKKADIDKGSFTTIEQLKQGYHLLKIIDDNPWVVNRAGYTYGHFRKDILLVHNGYAKNSTIAPYNNKDSNPSCSVYDLNNPISFKNITFLRDSTSSYKTFLLAIQGYNNVNIHSVSITTPPSNLVADCVMQLYDCTNVSFEDVSINGTYSRVDYSGYGIAMDNIWNYKANRLYCDANWGIFGNNNINLARIENSSINRFDVHCYGRDISFKKVHFNKLYNQFSSIFGDIIFDKCTFHHFIPVAYEYTYNAFTNHNVTFKDCHVCFEHGRCYLFYVGSISSDNTNRPIIIEKHLPNVFIKNMLIEAPVGDERMEIYRFHDDFADSVFLDGTHSLVVDRMNVSETMNSDNMNISLSNININSRGKIQVSIVGLNSYSQESHSKSTNRGILFTTQVNNNIHDYNVVGKGTRKTKLKIIE